LAAAATNAARSVPAPLSPVLVTVIVAARRELSAMPSKAAANRAAIAEVIRCHCFTDLLPIGLRIFVFITKECEIGRKNLSAEGKIFYPAYWRHVKRLCLRLQRTRRAAIQSLLTSSPTM